jgi:hypothetical protein
VAAREASLTEASPWPVRRAQHDQDEGEGLQHALRVA